MGDSVEIDEAAVEAVVAALRARGITWSGHATGLRIDGAGAGVQDKTDAAVTAWKKEFEVAGTAVTELADGVQADLDGFSALDSAMAKRHRGSVPKGG